MTLFPHIAGILAGVLVGHSAGEALLGGLAAGCAILAGSLAYCFVADEEGE